MIRNLINLVILALGLLVSQAAEAQTLTAGSASLPIGGTGEVIVTLDTSLDLAGFSYGLCETAPTVVSIADANANVVPGVDLAAVQGGGGPDFFAPAATTDNGHTVGCVVSFTGMDVIAIGDGQEVVSILFTAGNSAGLTTLEFCDTLGTPPVQTTVVDTAGAPILPALVSGLIEVVEQDPGYTYDAIGGDILYSPLDGIGGVTISPTIGELEDNPGFPNDTQGFSMGLGHDGSLLTATTLAANPILMTLNGGGGPDFFGPAMLSDGFTLGVVYNFLGQDSLPFASATPVVDVTYNTIPAALIGDEDGGSTPLTWRNDLGSPPVENVLVVAGRSQDVLFSDAVIGLIAVIETPFLRGDCNDDGLLNIADGIHILNRLFQGQDALGDCEDACDADNNGPIELADAMLVINYRFLDGAAPPAPFPACGIENGADCNSYLSCP